MSVRLCKTLLSAPAKAKVISTIYSYYHQSTVSGGNRACHRVYKGGRRSMSGRKKERRGKWRGVCEVERKSRWLSPPPTPTLQLNCRMRLFACMRFPFQPAIGPDRELNPGFTQPGPENLNSQPYQRQTKDKAGVTRSGLSLFELLQGRDFSKQQLSKDTDKHLDEVSFGLQLLKQGNRGNTRHTDWWKTNKL